MLASCPTGLIYILSEPTIMKSPPPSDHTVLLTGCVVLGGPTRGFIASIVIVLLPSGLVIILLVSAPTRY